MPTLRRRSTPEVRALVGSRLVGLRDAGWCGDPLQARLGAAVPGALVWLYDLPWGFARLREASVRAPQARVVRSIEALADRLAQARRQSVVDWVAEARELLDQL